MAGELGGSMGVTMQDPWLGPPGGSQVYPGHTNCKAHCSFLSFEVWRGRDKNGNDPLFNQEADQTTNWGFDLKLA